MHELWNIGIYLFKIVWKKCQIECRVFAKKKEKKKKNRKYDSKRYKIRKDMLDIKI